MPEGGRKNIFKDKQTTNKVPVMFLDVKVLRERKQLYFRILSRNKQGRVCVYLAFENLKISIKKVNSGEKAKSKEK